ncbi:hypothetical protein ACHAWF_003236, partial [Thalassiosira exigua]
MSVADFYVDNCVEPDWDAPHGMEGFLQRGREPQESSEQPLRDNRKRGRDEDYFDGEGCGRYGQGAFRGPTPDSAGIRSNPFPTNDESSLRPAKRARRSRELVQFGVPFPCAFERRRGGRGGGCRYRLSCSYHHGVPEPCACDSPACPRGHAHRRAPRRCDHGSVDACRWNGLGECSFHHGIPEACRCDSTRCPRAHPSRTRRNDAARTERKRSLARERPELADKNARELFLGVGEQKGVMEDEVRAKFNSWIRTSAPAEVDVEDDPIVGVKISAELNCAFLEFRTAELAAACLVWDGLHLEGWGKIRLERSKLYDPSAVPVPDPGGPIALDISRLDVIKPEPSKNAI